MTQKVPQNADLTATMLKHEAIHLGYRVGYVSNFYSGPVYKHIEQEFGIRRPKFATLFTLAQLTETSASEICLLTGIAKNTLSRAVNEMLHDGLLTRALDNKDNRRSILMLTTKGRTLYEKILPLFVVRQKHMVSVLTQQEAKMFKKILDKLIIRTDGWNEIY